MMRHNYDRDYEVRQIVTPEGDTELEIIEIYNLFNKTGSLFTKQEQEQNDARFK